MHDLPCQAAVAVERVFDEATGVANRQHFIAGSIAIGPLNAVHNRPDQTAGTIVEIFRLMPRARRARDPPMVVVFQRQLLVARLNVAQRSPVITAEMDCAAAAVAQRHNRARVDFAGAARLKECKPPIVKPQRPLQPDPSQPCAVEFR